MATSAARVVAALVADVCDIGTFDGGLTARLNRLADHVHQAMASSPGDAKAVAALDRAIQAGASKLGILGTNLADAVRHGSTATIPPATALLIMVCKLSNQLCNIAGRFTMPESAQALRCCVTLPLKCGSALMAAELSGGGNAASPADCMALEQQVVRLRSLITGRDAATDPYLAAKLTPSEPLLAWLSSIANVLLGTLRGAWLGTGPQLQVLACFLNIISTITSTPEYAVHAAALKRDTGLQQILVQLSLSALHRSAATVQLPSDRQPATFYWPAIASIVELLVFGFLKSTFGEQLAQPGSVGSTNWQKLVQRGSALCSRACQPPLRLD